MNGARNQHGGALVVSLVILLAMSFIGVTGMRATSLEEKMAGNVRNQDLAFQAAETALRIGELSLLQYVNPVDGTLLPPKSSFSCANIVVGWYDPKCYPSGANLPGSRPVWEELTATGKWSDAGHAVQLDQALGGLAQIKTRPAYVVEELSREKDTRTPNPGEAGVEVIYTGLYRITARGIGGTSDAVAVVQSTLKK